MSHRVEARVTGEIVALDAIIAERNERATVLSVACFLEDRLRDMHRQRGGLVVRPRKQCPELQCPMRNTKPPRNRPPSFHELIVYARANRLLTHDVLHDINRIAEIRNLFAHSFAVRTFANSPRAADICDQLRLPDMPGEQPPESIWVRARHRFDIAARVTTRALVDVIFQNEHDDREEQRAAGLYP